MRIDRGLYPQLPNPPIIPPFPRPPAGMVEGLRLVRRVGACVRCAWSCARRGMVERGPGTCASGLVCGLYGGGGLCVWILEARAGTGVQILVCVGVVSFRRLFPPLLPVSLYPPPRLPFSPSPNIPHPLSPAWGVLGLPGRGLQSWAGEDGTRPRRSLSGRVGANKKAGVDLPPL